MRAFCLAVIFAALLAGQALAQDYGAIDVVDEVRNSVVSIDINSLAVNYATLDMSTQSLLTRQITGVVYTENGYILTDSNSIDDGIYINVRFEDGHEYEGEFIGADLQYGVGVIKIDPDPDHDLKPIKMRGELYNSDVGSLPYEQGEPVLAIGYSGGYGGTVTSGIISAIRTFRNSRKILIPNMIQADCPINVGNEGCPLFNDQGEVIAFHDIQGGGGGLQRISFFSPAWIIKRVADEIIANHESERPANSEDVVWHPWLGIQPYAGSQGTSGLRAQSDDLKMFFGMPDQYWDVGVLLNDVWREGPAAEYGLRRMDWLMTVTVVNQDANTGEDTVKTPYQLIKTVQQLEVLVSTAERGDIFIFGVLRNGNMFDVEVTIGQHPAATAYLPDASSDLTRSDLARMTEYF